MGERLLCKQEVVGSIPITSTTERAQLVSTARLMRSISRRKVRQRLRSNRESARGERRRLIDREKQVCPGVRARGRLIFDR